MGYLTISFIIVFMKMLTTAIFLKAAGVLKLNSYWVKGFRKPLVFSSSIPIGLKDLESHWCSQTQFLLV
jgi:hypothetical protein